MLRGVDTLNLGWDPSVGLCNDCWADLGKRQAFTWQWTMAFLHLALRILSQTIFHFIFWLVFCLSVFQNTKCQMSCCGNQAQARPLAGLQVPVPHLRPQDEPFQHFWTLSRPCPFCWTAQRSSWAVVFSYEGVMSRFLSAWNQDQSNSKIFRSLRWLSASCCPLKSYLRERTV